MDHPQFEVGEKPLEPGPGYYSAPPERSRGCFFYGCIAALVAGVLGLILFVAGLVTLWYFTNRLIQDYTAAAPAAIPQVTLSEEDQKDLETRWDDFNKALDEGKEAEIVLTADEVNALIAREPKLKGRIHLTIEDDKVSAQVSIPLGETGFPLLKGRYLNGSGTVTVELADGELDVRLRDLEVKGKRVPPDALAQIGNKNLAEGFMKDPENRKTIRKFQSIEVKDDKVYIKARERSESPDEDKQKEQARDHDKDRSGDRPEDIDRDKSGTDRNAEGPPSPGTPPPADEHPRPKAPDGVDDTPSPHATEKSNDAAPKSAA